MQEQLIRRATEIGNGAHIFVPREWLNEEVVVARKPVAPLKERILQKIQEYLPAIKGAYLYGSQARGEATGNSDIDILMITSEPLQVKASDEGIIAIEEKKFTLWYKHNPLFMAALLSEAQPLLNNALLTELRKKYILTVQEREKTVQDIRNVLLKQEHLYALAEKTGGMLSGALLYSVFLRLRSTYWLECLKQKKSYRKEGYTAWLQKITKQTKKHVAQMETLYARCKQEKILKQTTLPLTSIRPYLDALHTFHDKP